MARFRTGNSEGTLESFEAGRGHRHTKVVDGTLFRFGKTGSLVLGGAFCLWLFLYISTIFPYLGTTSRGEMSTVGASMNTGMGTMGTERMLLFAGQTAFFEYDITASDDAAVTFDVHPYPLGAFSEQKQTLEGTQSGRVEFTVPSTGIYKFYHDFSVNVPGSAVKYNASWGAE